MDLYCQRPLSYYVSQSNSRIYKTAPKKTIKSILKGFIYTLRNSLDSKHNSAVLCILLRRSLLWISHWWLNCKLSNRARTFYKQDKPYLKWTDLQSTANWLGVPNWERETRVPFAPYQSVNQFCFLFFVWSTTRTGSGTGIVTGSVTGRQEMDN